MTEPGLERRHHRANESRYRQLLRRYRFELIWLSVVLLGIFLIVERMSIRVTLFRWVREGFSASRIWIDSFARGLGHLITHVTLSDAIGYLLILGALVAIALRVRWRLVHAPSLSGARCPQCDGEIHRVHRRFRDLIIGLFVPVRRYRCSNRECRWQGLRVTGSTRPVRSRGSKG